jgi:hypothetical protein
MNEAIRTRNHWKTAAIMLLAVLVLLVVALASMLQPAATTDASTPASSPAIHPGVHPVVHAPSAVGSGSTDDPYMNRHAEVVAGHQQGGPR